jgi:hypothetical protein
MRENQLNQRQQRWYNTTWTNYISLTINAAISPGLDQGKENWSPSESRC